MCLLFSWRLQGGLISPWLKDLSSQLLYAFFIFFPFPFRFRFLIPNSLIEASFHVKKGTKLRIADFVHGADGLGNQNFPPPKGKPIEQSAAAFLVQQANLYPGQVTAVALGPLTNIALVRFFIICIYFLCF